MHIGQKFAVEAIPGALAGIAVIYFTGVRRGNEAS